MAQKTYEDLLADLRAEPNSPPILENVMDDLLARELDEASEADIRQARDQIRDRGTRADADMVEAIQADLATRIRLLIRQRDRASQEASGGARRRKSQTKRFGSCVKAVRKTVKARKGSTAESAAIAICTTSILHPRGRTIKRYKKGRLLTQKRRA